MKRQTFIRNLLCMALAGALSLCFLSVAFAGGEDQPAREEHPRRGDRPESGMRGLSSGKGLRVKVDVIAASNAAPGIDREIAGISKQLKGMFGYRSYRLVDRARQPMAFGRSNKVLLPGLKTLEIYPKGIQGNKVEMNIQIKEKGRTLINTTLRVVNRGTFCIGGYPHAKGKLIIAITPEFD